MTTEELKAIQDRWADIRFLPSFPASQIEVLNLCAEVERLQKAVAEARELLRALAYITEDSSITAWLKRYEP